MTETAVDTVLAAVRLQAQESWTTFTRERNLTATAPDWHTSHTQDGGTTLSAQILGPGAGHALRLFASQFHVVLKEAGDTRPAFDYSVPGRTGCVWRSRGVWVELWHPDTAADAPEGVEPVQDGSVPSVAAPETKPERVTPARSLISRASDRLPFTRNRHKETTTT